MDVNSFMKGSRKVAVAVVREYGPSLARTLRQAAEQLEVKPTPKVRTKPDLIDKVLSAAKRPIKNPLEAWRQTSPLDKEHPLYREMVENARRGTKARGVDDTHERGRELLEGLFDQVTLKNKRTGQETTRKALRPRKDVSAVAQDVRDYQGLTKPERYDPRNESKPTKDELALQHSSRAYVRGQARALEAIQSPEDMSVTGGRDLTPDELSRKDADALENVMGRSKYTGYDEHGKPVKSKDPVPVRQGIAILRSGNLPDGWTIVGDEGSGWVVSDARKGSTQSFWVVSKAPAEQGKHAVSRVNRKMSGSMISLDEKRADETRFHARPESETTDPLARTESGKTSHVLVWKSNLQGKPAVGAPLKLRMGKTELDIPELHGITELAPGQDHDPDLVRRAAIAGGVTPDALLRGLNARGESLVLLQVAPGEGPKFRREIVSDQATHPLASWSSRTKDTLETKGRKVSSATEGERAQTITTTSTPPAFLDRASLLAQEPTITLPGGEIGRIRNVTSRTRPEVDETSIEIARPRTKFPERIRVEQERPSSTRGTRAYEQEIEVARDPGARDLTFEEFLQREGRQDLLDEYLEQGQVGGFLKPGQVVPEAHDLETKLAPYRARFVRLNDPRRMRVIRDLPRQAQGPLEQAGFKVVPHQPQTARPGERILMAHPDGRIVTTQPFDYGRALPEEGTIHTTKPNVPQTHYTGKLTIRKLRPNEASLLEPPVHTPSPAPELPPARLGPLESPLQLAEGAVGERDLHPDSQVNAEDRAVYELQSYLRAKQNQLLHREGGQGEPGDVGRLQSMALRWLKALNRDEDRAAFAALDDLHTRALSGDTVAEAQWKQRVGLLRKQHPQLYALYERALRGPLIPDPHAGKTPLDLKPDPNAPDLLVPTRVTPWEDAQGQNKLQVRSPEIVSSHTDPADPEGVVNRMRGLPPATDAIPRSAELAPAAIDSTRGPQHAITPPTAEELIARARKPAPPVNPETLPDVPGHPWDPTTPAQREESARFRSLTPEERAAEQAATGQRLRESQARVPKYLPGSLLSVAAALGLLDEDGEGEDGESETSPEVMTAGLNPALLGKLAKTFGRSASHLFSDINPAGVADDARAKLDVLMQTQEAPSVAEGPGVLKDLKRRFYDRLEPFYRWRDEFVRGGGTLTSEQDLRVQGPTNIHGGMGLAEDWAGRHAEPHLRAVNRAGLRQDLDRYLTLDAVERAHLTGEEHLVSLRNEIARKAARGLATREERHLFEQMLTAKYGGTRGPGGLGLDEARRLRSELLANLSPEQQALLERARQGIEAMNREALTALHREGLISQRDFDLYTKRGLLYTPIQVRQGTLENGVLWRLRRERLQSRLAHAGGTMGVRDEEVIQRLKGPDKIMYMESPTKASLQYAREVAEEVSRNRFAKAVVAQREFSPEAAQWIRPVVGKERLGPELGTISFFKNGQAQTFTLPADMADAMTLVETPDAETGLKLLKWGRSLVQGLATSANLAFLPRNLPRDLLDTFMLTKGLSPAKLPEFASAWGQHLMSIIRHDITDVRSRFKQSGGDYATISKNIAPEEFLPMEGLKRFSPLAFTRKMLNATEEATKTAAFDVLTRPGARFHGDDRGAAAEVRKFAGSPDFGQRGAMSKRASEFVLFFNPQVQGTGRLIGRYQEQPERLLWHMAGITAALGALNAHNLQFINPDTGRPALEDIPEAERQQNIIIMRPTLHTARSGQQKYDYYRIPLGHAARVLWTPIQDAYRMATGDPSVRADETVMDTVATLTPGTLKYDPNAPFASVAASLTSGLNPAIKVPFEQIADYNTYTGAPIVGRRLGRQPNPDQANESTSPAMALLGKSLGAVFGDRKIASPVRLEHAYRSLLPGPGEMALSGLDALVRGKFMPEGVMTPAERTSRIPIGGPIARGWMGTPSSQVRQDASEQLYGEEERLRTLVSKYNAASRQERVLLKQDPEMREALRRYPKVARAIRKLGKIAKQKDAARSQPDAERRLQQLWRKEMALLGVTPREGAPAPAPSAPAR